MSREGHPQKIFHEGHPQGAPLPIVNRFRLKNRSPKGLFSAVLSELGSNQVASRVLAQLDAIALTANYVEPAMTIGSNSLWGQSSTRAGHALTKRQRNYGPKCHRVAIPKWLCWRRGRSVCGGCGRLPVRTETKSRLYMRGRDGFTRKEGAPTKRKLVTSAHPCPGIRRTFLDPRAGGPH